MLQDLAASEVGARASPSFVGSVATADAHIAKTEKCDSHVDGLTELLDLLVNSSGRKANDRNAECRLQSKPAFTAVAN